MKHILSHLSVLLLTLFSLTLVACAPTKTIHELNPGVQFMSQKQAIDFLSGAKMESPEVIVTYKTDGKADLYVKHIAKDISATWEVKEDGMVIFRTPQRTTKFYLGEDGETSYRTTGKIVNFKAVE